MYAVVVAILAVIGLLSRIHPRAPHRVIDPADALRA